MIRDWLLVSAVALFNGCGAGCVGECGSTSPTPHVHGVTISQTAATLNVGGTVTLVATVSADAGVSTAANWTSSNSNIASVTQTGVVTAVTGGTAVITAVSAADSHYSAAATITVNPCVVRGITLSPANPTLVLNKAPLAIVASVDADACASHVVNWTSGNQAVFTVSQQGVLTAVGAGTATLTVTSQANVSLFATTSVTVVDPCASQTLALGTTTSGTVTTAGCPNGSVVPASYGNWYAYTTTGASTLIDFRLTATPVAPVIIPLFLGYFWYFDPGPGTYDSYVLVKSGTYGIFVGTQDTTRATPYSLTSFPNASPPPCLIAMATTGVSAALTLTTSSCPFTPSGSVGTFYSHQLWFALDDGTVLKVTVSSNQFSPLVEIRNGNTNALLVSTAAQTGNQVTASYTITPGVEFPIVYVTSRVAGQTGAYSLTIQP